MKKLVLAGACLLALAGCDAVGSMKGHEDEAPAATTPDPAVAARETFKAKTVIVPSADIINRLAVPNGVSATLSEHDTLLVTGGPDAGDRPGGKTAGASIELTPEQEKAFANKKLTVKILARSGNGETVKGRAAYSTNETGNSNWRKFEVGPEYSVFSFTYDVPAMEKGLGDYIGILPVDGPIEVAAIGFTAKPLPAAGETAPAEGETADTSE